MDSWNVVSFVQPDEEIIVLGYGKDSDHYLCMWVSDKDMENLGMWIDVARDYTEVNTTITHWKLLSKPY